jgi:hypothetical protein
MFEVGTLGTPARKEPHLERKRMPRHNTSRGVEVGLVSGSIPHAKCMRFTQTSFLFRLF